MNVNLNVDSLVTGISKARRKIIQVDQILVTLTLVGGRLTICFNNSMLGWSFPAPVPVVLTVLLDTV